MKINNRKKEIEMMKSINIEKQKLRLLQNKQEDLNKLIYSHDLTTCPEKNTNNTNNINNTNNNNTKMNANKSTTLKNHISIYNINDKKTKKNISLIKDVKDVINVIDVVKKHIPIISNETNSVIKDSVSNVVSTTTNNTTNNQKNNMNDTIKIKNTNILDTNTSNIPYKFYYKKDIKKYNLDVKWGSKEEIYNKDKFTKNISMVLSIQPLFITECINKINNDKQTIEDKIKILNNIYNFKNIKKIKNTVINLIYNILVYDNVFE